MALPALAHPGLFLGSCTQYSPGLGTHVYDSNIYASLSGRPTVMQSTASSNMGKSTNKAPKALPQICIPRLTSSNTLPQVNSIVLCRVTRIQSRQITVEILVVDDQVCKDSWQGVVRKEDVRGWEIDKVVMAEAFRVGDLVRGTVISLGDQSNYYLSTARNELGVLMATSEEGNTMHPISWKEFKDPETGKTEIRKVAKPF